MNSSLESASNDAWHMSEASVNERGYDQCAESPQNGKNKVL